MKKFILICSIFAMISTLSSCVKAYDCTCIYMSGGEELTTVASIESGRNAAETTCAGSETELKKTYPDASCTLSE